MIVIGIDPGFDRLGWAIGQVLKNRQINLLSCGLISTKKTASLYQRYRQLDTNLSALIQEFKVKEAAIESLFFGTNQKTIIQVAQARGVIINTLLRHQVTVFEYSPQQIKAAVTGFGRTDKKGVEKMVRLQLKIPPAIKIIDDTFDALATLLTHGSFFNR